MHRARRERRAHRRPRQHRRRHRARRVRHDLHLHPWRDRDRRDISLSRTSARTARRRPTRTPFAFALAPDAVLRRRTRPSRSTPATATAATVRRRSSSGCPTGAPGIDAGDRELHRSGGCRSRTPTLPACRFRSPSAVSPAASPTSTSASTAPRARRRSAPPTVGIDHTWVGDLIITPDVAGRHDRSRSPRGRVARSTAATTSARPGSTTRRRHRSRPSSRRRAVHGFVLARRSPGRIRRRGRKRHVDAQRVRQRPFRHRQRPCLLAHLQDVRVLDAGAAHDNDIEPGRPSVADSPRPGPSAGPRRFPRCHLHDSLHRSGNASCRQLAVDRSRSRATRSGLRG